MRDSIDFNNQFGGNGGEISDEWSHGMLPSEPVAVKSVTTKFDP
jgi:hypothetical protein